MTPKEFLKNFFKSPLSRLKFVAVTLILTFIFTTILFLVNPLPFWTGINDENILVLNGENSVTYEDAIPINNLKVNDFGIIAVNKDIFIYSHNKLSIFIIPDDVEPRYLSYETETKMCDDNTIIGKPEYIIITRENHVLFVSKDVKREMVMKGVKI